MKVCSVYCSEVNHIQIHIKKLMGTTSQFFLLETYQIYINFIFSAIWGGGSRLLKQYNFDKSLAYRVVRVFLFALLKLPWVTDYALCMFLFYFCFRITWITSTLDNLSILG